MPVAAADGAPVKTACILLGRVPCRLPRRPALCRTCAGRRVWKCTVSQQSAAYAGFCSPMSAFPRKYGRMPFVPIPAAHSRRARHPCGATAPPLPRCNAATSSTERLRGKNGSARAPAGGRAAALSLCFYFMRTAIRMPAPPNTSRRTRQTPRSRLPRYRSRPRLPAPLCPQTSR